MKRALAVLCYGRAHYFELVLPTIINQKIFGKPVSEVYDIHIFQDGLWENEKAETIAGHNFIRKLLENLCNKFTIICHRSNLGVALLFDFAERLLFLEKDYDFVVFCEDDVVLAPGFMQAVDLMGLKFKDDPRIGMVSAHPHNPMRSIEDQRKNLSNYLSMGHQWLYGISKSAYLKRQPMVDLYLTMLSKENYRNRPTERILKWLIKMGFRPDASSQDYIKKCATLANGMCRLSTYANYGLPIGREGLHFRSNQFKKYGLNRSIVFDSYINQLPDLNENIFNNIYMHDAYELGQDFVENIASDCNGWAKKLLSGEFNPIHLDSEFKSALESSQINIPTNHSNTSPQAILLATAPPSHTNRENMELVLENFNSVMEKLYGEDIWNGFKAPLGVQEVQGWNGNHPVFGKLIQELKPEVVIDVGVWKGLSSITLARSMKEAGVNGCVLSVDTFLGSPEHWSHTRNLFKRKHGIPDLYDQFMSNVYHAGMQDIIIPMPQLSHVAARLLHKMGIRAKLIHIDAAHEYEEVLRDAIAYWEVLEEGGVMVGDDYHPTWPGVVKAADEFAKKVGRSLQVESPKWILRK